jgi:glycosyltransferase involved in cell wall biosynthesis
VRSPPRSRLRVDVLARNRGKGAAVLHALEAARAEGFSHALTMDADGQHPADLIPTFMTASAAHPGAMILGRPVFDASAPLLRVRGRRISNAWTNLETLGAGIDDSLYGFRVYPIAPLVEIMRAQIWSAASTSTPRPWCGSRGAASRRSTSRHRSSTSGPTRAASRISATAATMRC